MILYYDRSRGFVNKEDEVVEPRSNDVVDCKVSDDGWEAVLATSYDGLIPVVPAGGAVALALLMTAEEYYFFVKRCQAKMAPKRV